MTGTAFVNSTDRRIAIWDVREIPDDFCTMVKYVIVGMIPRSVFPSDYEVFFIKKAADDDELRYVGVYPERVEL